MADNGFLKGFVIATGLAVGAAALACKALKKQLKFSIELTSPDNECICDGADDTCTCGCVDNSVNEEKDVEKDDEAIEITLNEDEQ